MSTKTTTPPSAKSAAAATPKHQTIRASKVELPAAPAPETGIVQLEVAQELLIVVRDDIFASDESIAAAIESVRKQALAFVPDISSRKGREEIKSLAYRVARSKTALDAHGKSMVEDEKKKIAIVDARRKKICDAFDALKEQVRAPLTEWEDAEKARIAIAEAFVASLTGVTLTGTAAELQAKLKNFEAIELTDRDLREFQAPAEAAYIIKLGELRAALADALQAEADAAELAELRKMKVEKDKAERESKIAAEAAAKAKADAEMVAEHQRATAEARAKAEAEAALAAERTRSAVAEAELKRQADAKAAEEAEAKRRAADYEHKAGVNTRAANALMNACGLSETKAKAVIQAIAAGMVPGIQVIY